MKSKDKPWMKSNPSKCNPAKQDFIAKAISSTKGGFHPSKTDLTAWYSVKSITLFLLLFFFLSIYSLSWNMFTKDELDMFSLCCEPPKLILRSGEPQPLKLDILSLRANSIWDKSLVCAANISSASAHIEFVYLAFGEVCKPYRKSREGFISMRVLR